MKSPKKFKAVKPTNTKFHRGMVSSSKCKVSKRG